MNEQYLGSSPSGPDAPRFWWCELCSGGWYCAFELDPAEEGNNQCRVTDTWKQRHSASCSTFHIMPRIPLCCQETKSVKPIDVPPRSALRSALYAGISHLTCNFHSKQLISLLGTYSF
jgi:hypothetical protein